MTQRMHGLLKLFSTTPVLGPSRNTRLLLPIHSRVYPLGLLIASRVLVTMCLLIVLSLNYFSLLPIVLLFLFFARDLCFYAQTESLVALGYDEGFFGITQNNKRLKLELHGEAFVIAWLVAISFREVEEGGVGRARWKKRKSYPCILGSWNMARNDFHKLRQLLVRS